jgi:hypothetical protein
MVFRGTVRGGIADAAFGRVRLLPVIADGDSRAPPPEPEMRGQSRHLESQWAPPAPPIPVGPAVVAEIQSDQMDSTLVPLPLVNEPAAACAIMFHSH